MVHLRTRLLPFNALALFHMPHYDFHRLIKRGKRLAVIRSPVCPVYILMSLVCVHVSIVKAHMSTYATSDIDARMCVSFIS